MPKQLDASLAGSFGAQYALAQQYGSLVERYLKHGSDTENGGVREGSWVPARDQAGIANVEAWWWRYHRAMRARYASRQVAVGLFCYVAGLLTAATIIYFTH